LRFSRILGLFEELPPLTALGISDFYSTVRQ